MLVSGALLLTGTTIAQVLGATGRAVRRAGSADPRRRAHRAHPAAAARRRPGPTRPATRSRSRGPTRPSRSRPSASPPTSPTRTRPRIRPRRRGRRDDDFSRRHWRDRGRAAERAARAGQPAPRRARTGRRRWAAARQTDGVTASEEIDYKPPPAKALEKGKADPGPDTRDREATAKALLESLRHFGVEARLLGIVCGPHVSRYELQLAPGTKVSKVAQLKDDLAYALASTDIRILAPIPGKKAVGRRGPERAPAPGPPRRHLRRAAEGRLAARRLARQGRLRPGGRAPTWR